MVGCFLKSKMELPYRRNVAGILFDGKKILLVTKPGLGFWQFVQGGIESEETNEEAISREIKEETGIKDFKIIKKLSGTHKWDWVPELQKRKGFRGQQQSFMFVNVEPNQKIKLQKEELEDYKWVLPEEIKKFIKYPQDIINEILEEVKKLK